MAHIAPLLALSRAAAGTDAEALRAALRGVRKALAGASWGPVAADTVAEEAVDLLLGVWTRWAALLAPKELEELVEAPMRPPAMPPLHSLLALWRVGPDTARLRATVRVLPALLESDEALRALLAGTRDEGAVTVAALCDALAGLPQRIINAMRHDAPAWLFPAAFFPRLCALAIETCPPQLLSALVDKLVAVGQARALVAAWVAQIRRDPAAPRHAESAAALSPASLERVLGLMLRRTGADADACALLSALLPPTRLSPHARFLVSSQLLLRANIGLGDGVVQYLRLCGHDMALETAQRLGRVWGEATFTTDTEEALQAQVTSLFEALLLRGGLRRSDVESGALLQDILTGVRHHLGSALPAVRDHGQRVAVAFSVIMGSPMSFSPPSSPRPPSPPSPPAATAAAPAPAPAPVPQLVRLRPMEVLGDSSSGESSGEDSSAEEERVPEFDEEGEGGEGEEEDGWDSEDSLQPYDLDDDESDLGTVAPLYLRDCLNDLNSKPEEHERREGALKAVPGLVRARPDDLTPELAVQLTSAVIHISNERGIEDFDADWAAALKALCAVLPERVAPFLCTQFASPNHVLSTKFAVLRTLVAAARELAKMKQDDDEEEKEGVRSLPALLLEPKGGAPRQQQEQQQGQSRTRRWGYRRSAAPQTIVNEFLPVVGSFFHALLRAAHDEDGRLLPVLQREPPLLGSLLSALGCFVECARNGFALQPLATSLIDVAWSQHRHPDAAVRRGVLFALSRVLLVVPRQVLWGECGAAMALVAVWLDEAASKDPDPDCRDFAGALKRAVPTQ